MRLTLLTLAALVLGVTAAPDAAAASSGPHVGPGCTALHWRVAFPHAPWQHRHRVYHGVTIICGDGDGLPF